MKYYGDKKITEIKYRRLKYLRCDKCNKKIIENDDYYLIGVNLNSQNLRNYPDTNYKEICCECAKDFINEYLDENIDIKHINIQKFKFQEDKIYNTNYNSISDELVENDN